MRLNKFLHSLVAIVAVVALFSSCFHEDNKISATCFDEVLNQEELFVDCGGPNCDECPPACDNGILDWEEGWQEVGIDCGGPCETCCENERWDVNPNDPSLSEEWIDCGGPECPPCEMCSNGISDPGEEFLNPVTGMIESAIDCDNDPMTECPPCSELCNDGLLNGLEDGCADCGGVCIPCDNSQCSNEVLDEFDPEATTTVQSETYIDCGGCLCIPCDDISLCFDGYISGYETEVEVPPGQGFGIDCGGPYCVPCNDPILCGDGILNGYETEIDCYDGEEGLSACPPCNSTCSNGNCDGLETDLNCGGDFCPPCAVEEGNFMTYTVTTSEETQVFYESANATLTGFFIKGINDPTMMPPLVQDLISFGGGSCHSIGFVLEDDDNAPLFWGKEEDFYLNFIAQTLPSPDNVILDANTNDFVYESRISPTGITLNDFEINGPNPIPCEFPLTGNDCYEITVEGTFSGELKVADDATMGIGEIATVTNGEFKITWQQNIPD